MARPYPKEFRDGAPRVATELNGGVVEAALGRQTRVGLVLRSAGVASRTPLFRCG